MKDKSIAYIIFFALGFLVIGAFVPRMWTVVNSYLDDMGSNRPVLTGAIIAPEVERQANVTYSLESAANSSGTSI